MRRLRFLLLLPVLCAFGGCAVYPASPGYYGRPYAPPPVAVYPRPYYGGYGYRPYGYGYGGYRRW